LPEQWNTGRFNGLCVRGGAEVDLDWKNGKPEKARIKATADNTFKVKVPTGVSAPRCEKNGQSVDIVSTNGLMEFTLKKGDIVSLKYNDSVKN
jgi:alpha-L-fucosidase 2